MKEWSTPGSCVQVTSREAGAGVPGRERGASKVYLLYNYHVLVDYPQ